MFVITRFMTNNEENNCGWVIKAPFTTNCESVRFPKSFDSMKFYMGVLSRKYFGHIPYLMIQPCMYNRREYKVVSLNNVPTYVATIATGKNKKSIGGVNKSFASTDELLSFAAEAIERFRLNAPFAVTDGLLRVDIFQDATGQMVVNEFESLDANYSASPELMMATHSFLIKYWENKIEQFLTR